MITNNIIIPISTSDGELELVLHGESHSDTIEVKDDAIENGEATVQIKEGATYEYKINEGFSLRKSEIVFQSTINTSSGRICPNIYVGTLSIEIIKNLTKELCAKVNLEVQSVKASYRQDYRQMLEEISENCVDLLLYYNSEVSQYFQTDFNSDAKTLYQRFAFVKSVLDSNEFSEAVHKVIQSPVTRWRESVVTKDIRNLKRFTSSITRQLSSATNRIDLPISHPFRKVVSSIPSKIKVSNKAETVDTPENRFVKHALITFQSFCNDFLLKIEIKGRILDEAKALENRLEQFLSHPIFKDVSTPSSVPLNSPVLQRKGGYREILKAWLMFDLAAKIAWQGGDDVYRGNKRDVAVLYEYWLFFKLLEIVKDVFKISILSPENYTELYEDGIGMKLKQGKYLPIKGIFLSEIRNLNIELSYNKSFKGNTEYPEGGSWTREMRPDYSLSIWPYGIDQEQAEKEELIVHLHFDAKYRVENFRTILDGKQNLDEEKEEHERGTYKRADLLKMHAYKDAIRRTAGAYVLYPGTEDLYTKSGFHELIPGLGAFAIRPSKSDDGSKELRRFLNEVLIHFMNRASQREKMSYKVFSIYKNSDIGKLNELLPETIGVNRDLIPDEVFILVGYFKNNDHFNWIQTKGLYNARAEDDRGSLKLGIGEAGARYLLLHTKNETITSKLFRILEIGPRVFSRKKLIQNNYPSEPTQDYYLVYKVEEVNEVEFKNQKWDITKLEAYKGGRESALPFSITLSELMKVVVK